MDTNARLSTFMPGIPPRVSAVSGLMLPAVRPVDKSFGPFDLEKPCRSWSVLEQATAGQPDVMVHVYDAGVGSMFPAVSTART